MKLRRSGSAQSPRRSSVGGAADLPGGGRLSRKHSIGFQDTLARASLSFGQGHNKVEVRLASARALMGSEALSSQVQEEIGGLDMR